MFYAAIFILWCVNYWSADAHTHTRAHQEAALYVHEGEDNNKFYHHPAGKWSKLAYNILHHPAFYISDLITSILLMLLAFIERPSLATEFQTFDRPQMRIMVVVRHSVTRVLPSSFPPFFLPFLPPSLSPSLPPFFLPSLLPTLLPPLPSFLPPTIMRAVLRVPPPCFVGHALMWQLFTCNLCIPR